MGGKCCLWLIQKIVLWRLPRGRERGREEEKERIGKSNLNHEKEGNGHRVEQNGEMFSRHWILKRSKGEAIIDKNVGHFK